MLYKVIALSVGGKNNKIHRLGDLVSDGAFSVPADKLVEQGFLAPVDDTPVKDVESENKPEKEGSLIDAISDAAGVDFDESEEVSDESIPDYNDISKTDIMNKLVEVKGLKKNKDFNKNQSKRDLYDLLKGK